MKKKKNSMKNKFIKFFIKIARALTIPVIISVVCLLLFTEALNNFYYIQFIRIIIVIAAFISSIGNVMDFFINRKK